MFSIVDVDATPEEFEGEEGAAEDEDAPLPSYPIRCSIAITKVCILNSFQNYMVAYLIIGVQDLDERCC